MNTALNKDKRPPLPGHHMVLGETDKLRLDSGVEFGPFTLAYQTYGELNAEKSNAILVCHALTGDQYVADDVHPITGKEGWWREIVGPGKIIDTDKYFVICSNVIGGCLGSTGPKDINPETGKPWGEPEVAETISLKELEQGDALDEKRIDAIVAFLKTLTDARYEPLLEQQQAAKAN